MKLIFNIGILLTIALPLRADILDITGQSQARLGFGVDPITEKVFNKCLETGNDVVTAEDTVDPSQTNPRTAFDMPFSVEQVTSSQKMDHYSSQSVSASASYGIYSGSFSYSGQNSQSLFSDRAVVGIEATADYGRWYLKKAELKPEYAQLATRNIKEFYAVCGTEFVVGYRLGQGLRVVMMTATQVTETYSSIQASIKAGVNAGVASGNLAGAFMDTAYNLLKMGSLEVRLTSFGSGPLADLKKLINTPADVKAFRDNISELLGGMKPELAVRTHYVTRPYFPANLEYDQMMTEHRKAVVKQLYSDYRQLFDTQNRLNDAFRGDRIKGFLREVCAKDAKPCDDYIESLQKIRSEIGTRLDEIQNAVKKCSQAKKISECSSRGETAWEMSELQRISWPASFRYQLLKAQLDEVRRR